MKEAFFIIVFLSFIIFFLITIIRIVAVIFYKNIIKKYLDLLTGSNNNYIPSGKSDILYRDKDLEKKKEEELIKNVQKLSNIEPNYNKKNIVGIVKPIGYWTSLIMGQKVTYLMQRADILKQQNDSGYWVNMLHARDHSRGKNRGI